jgi:hypothetical protein
VSLVCVLVVFGGLVRCVAAGGAGRWGVGGGGGGGGGGYS